MSTDLSAARASDLGGRLAASAWSLMAGGLVFALGNLLHPLEHNDAAFAYPTWAAAHLLILLSVPLLILGFPALYAALERGGAERLGLATIVLGVFGLVGLSPGLLVEAYIAPEVGYQTMERLEASGYGAVGGLLPLLWIVSSFPLAVACARAKLGPRWAAVLLVVSALAMLIAGGMTGPVVGAAIIAATAAYGLVIAVLGWYSRAAVSPRHESRSR